MASLRDAAEQYIALRRSLGFALRGPARLLSQFIAFLEERSAPYVRTSLALEWARQPAHANPATWAQRLSVVRGFAQFRSATDPRTQIPSVGLLSCKYSRKTPYVYKDHEITALLRAAGGLRSKAGLRALTYSALIGLLTVTGMRISEVIALTDNDVDLVDGVLLIRRTKFGKSRQVPIHETTQRALRQYVRSRDRVLGRNRCKTFLAQENGAPLTQCGIRGVFVRLSRQVGLRTRARSHGHGPRIHDFRHRLAVSVLVRWYREGRDVEQHLPKLATFLGHTHVTDTYWYLTAVPELLQLAMARLESSPRGSQ